MNKDFYSNCSTITIRGGEMNINVDKDNKLVVEKGYQLFKTWIDTTDKITGKPKVIFSSNDSLLIKGLATTVESLTLMNPSDFVQAGVFGKQDFRVNYHLYKCLESIYTKYNVKMMINFAYRRYLSTCGGDINGMIDATDLRSHALGCALDLPTLRNAQLFKCSEADFIKLMAEYNLVRPFLNPKIFKQPETWHFRWMGEVKI